MFCPCCGNEILFHLTVCACCADNTIASGLATEDPVVRLRNLVMIASASSGIAAPVGYPFLSPPNWP
jgi:hypothetical protein